MSLRARMRADARLAALQILAQDKGYSANHDILRLGIDKATAITLSADEVRDMMSWLEDAGLVTTEVVAPFVIAKLTNKGLEAARGQVEVDGVSKPPPDAM